MVFVQEDGAISNTFSTVNIATLLKFLEGVDVKRWNVHFLLWQTWTQWVYKAIWQEICTQACQQWRRPGRVPCWEGWCDWPDSSLAKHPLDFLGGFQYPSHASCILRGNSATRVTTDTLLIFSWREGVSGYFVCHGRDGCWGEVDLWPGRASLWIAVPRSETALSALLKEWFCKGASGSLVQFSLVLEAFRECLCPQREDQLIMVHSLHRHFI